MRILVHDYGGYAFPAQLSGELSRRGHEVMHAYCGSIEAPTGRVGASTGFELREVKLSRRIEKRSFWSRRQLEIECGRRLAELVDEFRPDVVLSGNAPLEAQARLLARCRQRGVGFVFWVHDVYSAAVHAILRKKLPVAGELIGRYYMRMERRLLCASDQIIVVSEDFLPLMRRWGVTADVIENWAALESTPVLPKPDAKLRILYSGILGMKHNPALLAELARALPEVEVVVISEGTGADWLRAQSVPNLIVRPFQPFARLPEALASADVLVAILSPEASTFSVPSKVMTYLCAGRALLLSVPAGNLAARIVTAERAGEVVPANDSAALAAAARRLIGDAARREECGRNARAFAKRQFAIGPIADRFEAVLTRAARRPC